MIPEDKQQKVDDLFERASALVEENWSGFLDAECKDCPADVRREVEKMLQAYAETSACQPAPFPGLGGAAAIAPRDPIVGKRVGSYIIRKQIGRGGFGLVYVAERDEDYRQKVAVKLVRSEFVAEEKIIERFRLEREALAVLQHENIARLLDGGTTEEGWPYFVMEYIEGEPIPDYCDRHQLPIEERLGLFQQVCGALKSAHDFGYIHRDIKPSNVFVTSGGVPKLLDFGIAKLIDPRARRQNVSLTESGVPLTPEYASPEQIRGDRDKISTATDVYSLGVLLYQLMTGHYPYVFSNPMLAEIERVICNEEPTKPSSAVLSSAETSTHGGKSTAKSPEQIGELRQTTPTRLSRLLRGDLETILLKAIQKEPARRYDSPLSLSDDIENYLHGRPVKARPDSALYRAKKFVARNRGAAIAATLLLVSLVVGASTSTFLWLRESSTREQAEANFERSIRVLDILTESFASVTPEFGATANMPAKDVLFNAMSAVEESDLDAQGRVLILQKLSECFVSVGEYQQAIDAADKALTLSQQQTNADLSSRLAAMHFLAVAFHSAGKIEEAISVYEEVLASSDAQRGPRDYATLENMKDLGDAYLRAGRCEEALSLHTEVYHAFQERFGEDDARTLSAAGSLASCYLSLAQYEKAKRIREDSLKKLEELRGPTHPMTLSAKHNRAVLLLAMSENREAITLLEKVLPEKKQTLGPDHPETIISQQALAWAYYLEDNAAEAIRLLDEILAICKAKLGVGHPYTISVMTALGVVYGNAGWPEEALRMQEDAWSASKAAHGDDYPSTLRALHNLGTANLGLGRLARAVELLEKHLQLSTVRNGPKHPDTLTGMVALAMAYKGAGQLDKSIQLYEATLETSREVLGDDHRNTVATMNNLAVAYQKSGQIDKAMPLYQEALTARRTTLGSAHAKTVNTMINLASAHADEDDLEKAIPLFEESLTALRNKSDPNKKLLHSAMDELSEAYESVGRSREAAELREEMATVSVEP